MMYFLVRVDDPHEDDKPVLRPNWLAWGRILRRSAAAERQRPAGRGCPRATSCAIEAIYGVRKMQFGSGSSDVADLKDHGVITGYFATTN